MNTNDTWAEISGKDLFRDAPDPITKEDGIWYFGAIAMHECVELKKQNEELKKQNEELREDFTGWKTAYDDDIREARGERAEWVDDLESELEELKEKYKKLRLSKMVWDCLLSYNERFCSIIDDWDEPTKDYVDGWVEMFKDEDTIKKHLYEEWSAGW